MFDLSVPWSFEGPEAGSVAIDHARVGTVAVFALLGENLGGNRCQRVTGTVSGKLRGDRRERLRPGMGHGLIAGSAAQPGPITLTAPSAIEV